MAHDEKLYFNGDIYTVDERAPSVEAVAVFRLASDATSAFAAPRPAARPAARSVAAAPAPRAPDPKARAKVEAVASADEGDWQEF